MLAIPTVNRFWCDPPEIFSPLGKLEASFLPLFCFDSPDFLVPLRGVISFLARCAFLNCISSRNVWENGVWMEVWTVFTKKWKNMAAVTSFPSSGNFLSNQKIYSSQSLCSPSNPRCRCLLQNLCTFPSHFPELRLEYSSKWQQRKYTFSSYAGPYFWLLWEPSFSRKVSFWSD